MLSDDIRYLTDRALWETENLMKCIPDELWEKRYDGIPMWKEDPMRCENPANCDMSRFRLILGQFRHWHRHMGVVYGFIIEDTGKWPYVLNMRNAYPDTPMPNFY